MSDRRGPERPLLAFRTMTEVIGVDETGRLRTARRIVEVDLARRDIWRAFRRDADYFDAPFL